MLEAASDGRGSPFIQDAAYPPQNCHRGLSRIGPKTLNPIGAFCVGLAISFPGSRAWSSKVVP